MTTFSVLPFTSLFQDQQVSFTHLYSLMHIYFHIDCFSLFNLLAFLQLFVLIYVYSVTTFIHAFIRLVHLLQTWCMMCVFIFIQAFTFRLIIISFIHSPLDWYSFYLQFLFYLFHVIHCMTFIFIRFIMFIKFICSCC